MLAEDLVLAVGACTILAFARILWQMARQERLLREMMRVQQELLMMNGLYSQNGNRDQLPRCRRHKGVAD